eukprot:238047-Pleurochrysis_carterae.AAC.4
MPMKASICTTSDTSHSAVTNQLYIYRRGCFRLGSLYTTIIETLPLSSQSKYFNDAVKGVGPRQQRAHRRVGNLLFPHEPRPHTSQRVTLGSPVRLREQCGQLGHLRVRRKDDADALPLDELRLERLRHARVLAVKLRDHGYAAEQRCVHRAHSPADARRGEAELGAEQLLVDLIGRLPPPLRAERGARARSRVRRLA